MDLSQFKWIRHIFLYEKPSENGDGEEDDPENGEGEEEAEDEIAFTPEQQKRINSMLAKTKKAEQEKARLAAEAKAKQDKENAEKAKLEEQGEFKKLKEAAEQQAEKEKVRADKAEAETSRLKLQRQFEVAVAEAGLEFVSPKAADDAFSHLDTDAVGEDYEGMAEAVDSLIKDYDYLFGEKTVKAPDIDAVTKSNVSIKKVVKSDLRKQKKRSGRYSAI